MVTWVRRQNCNVIPNSDSYFMTLGQRWDHDVDRIPNGDLGTTSYSDVEKTFICDLFPTVR